MKKFQPGSPGSVRGVPRLSSPLRRLIAVDVDLPDGSEPKAPSRAARAIVDDELQQITRAIIERAPRPKGVVFEPFLEK